MKNFAIFLTIFSLTAFFAKAQELSFEGTPNPRESMQEYFKQEYPKYTKSIIYAFYNPQECYSCDKAINIIQQIYNQYYKGKYDFYIVDYQSDLQYNYIGVYNLSQPLEVVMARVVDGSGDGFEKIEGLEYETSDPISLSEDFRYRIDSFLGQ